MGTRTHCQMNVIERLIPNDFNVDIEASPLIVYNNTLRTLHKEAANPALYTAMRVAPTPHACSSP